MTLLKKDFHQNKEHISERPEEIPKGYWLVEAQWYKLVQTSQRAYVLLKEKIILNVNSMVRLPEPIVLEVVKARKSAPPKPPPPPSARSSARLQAQPAQPQPQSSDAFQPARGRATATAIGRRISTRGRATATATGRRSSTRG